MDRWYGVHVLGQHGAVGIEGKVFLHEDGTFSVLQRKPPLEMGRFDPTETTISELQAAGITNRSGDRERPFQKCSF